MIADDHSMFREGVIALLAEEKDLTIVAEAASGTEVLELLQQHKVDVLLLDIEMAGMDGFDTMRQLRQLTNAPSVLVVSMHRSPQFIKKILQGGAAGYVHKDAGKATLVKAVHQIVDTGKYYTPEVAQLLVESYQQATPSVQLSKREKEVITHICNGLTTREIAEQLFLSKHTIESHRQNILLKLGLKNSTALVKYAVQNGLV